MYVELLSAALAGNEEGPMRMADVRSSAVDCRDRMLASRTRVDRSVERELANEIGYDCSLINLCTALGIEAEAERFAQPASERARLEKALADVGEDL
jgi:hypothetical protein